MFPGDGNFFDFDATNDGPGFTSFDLRRDSLVIGNDS